MSVVIRCSFTNLSLNMMGLPNCVLHGSDACDPETAVHHSDEVTWLCASHRGEERDFFKRSTRAGSVHVVSSRVMVTGSIRRMAALG